MSSNMRRASKIAITFASLEFLMAIDFEINQHSPLIVAKNPYNTSGSSLPIAALLTLNFKIPSIEEPKS